MKLFKEIRARRERFERLRNFVIHQGKDKYTLNDVLPFPISVHSAIKREDEEMEGLVKNLLELGHVGSNAESLRTEAQICERMSHLALAGSRRRHAKSWWRRLYIEWSEQGARRRWYPFAREEF